MQGSMVVVVVVQTLVLLHHAHGHASARHETQCSIGSVTQPLDAWGKRGLKRS